MSRPAGAVSTIRGHWQAPALTAVWKVMLVLSFIGLLVPGRVATVLAAAVVAAAIAIPLLRVCWLILRWWQERDIRFVVVGITLLALVGCSAIMGLG